MYMHMQCDYAYAVRLCICMDKAVHIYVLLGALMPVDLLAMVRATDRNTL